MSASGPEIVATADLDLSRWLASGDGVVFGQACAEPTVLVDALLAQAAAIGPLRAFGGLSWRDELALRAPESLQFVSYGALGRLGRLSSLVIVPGHYSGLPRLFAEHALPGDVALVQVAPPDSQGRCSLGVAADYLADALAHARVVIAEVNDHVPRTAGAWVAWDAIDVAVRTSAPLLEAPHVTPGDVERRIAGHVAELVRDGDTIQLGVGAIPEAILAALAGHRRLGIHSGMISDGVLDLIEAGVITGESKPTDAHLAVTGSALGSRRLFSWLDGREGVLMCPTSYTHAPATLARVGRLCAINSALEIDLQGQANSESISGRRIGAVGGQIDFLRAAAASGGRGIIALPAARIVPALHGPVSAAAADVDWVVTEHGARSLRGLSPERRAAALGEISGDRDRGSPQNGRLPSSSGVTAAPAPAHTVSGMLHTEPDPSPFIWGDSPRRGELGGIPFLLFEPRRRRVPELLADAERWRDRVHLVQGDRHLTFAHVFAAIDQVAARLVGMGVGPGDRLLLLAANSPEWVISMWAALRIGAIVAPGNGWWSGEEVEHAMDLVEPTVVIGDAKRLTKVRAGARTLDITELRSLVDAAPTAPTVELPPIPAADENDPALIVFTAGTTGLPKGVTLAHRSWIAQMHQTLAVSRRLPHTLADDDRGFVSMLTGPLFHIGGIHATGLAMLGAGKLVFLDGRFDPGQVLELIEREKVEVWGAIPTMTLRVLDHPDIATRDVSSMRSIPLGGAPVSPELMDRLQAAFPNTERRITQVYGMAETSGTVARASGKLLRTHRGTTGHPLPLADIVIATPDPVTGEGEILVRCPTQMLGYWKDEAATVIDADGFVHTGDLGRIDDEGLLYITGRAKDVIIRGGENIAAPQVETALLSHPDVADAAVVGLPHRDLGEEVGAAVLPRAGATLDPEALAVYLESRIASFAIPSRWWISEEALPMTDAGKADKKRLRQIFPSHATA